MVEPIFHTVHWAQGFDLATNCKWNATKHDVITIGDYRSTTLALSRCLGIYMALKLGADWHIQVDADNPPTAPLDAIVPILNAAASRRFGMIVSPSVNKRGVVGVNPPGGGKYGGLGEIPVGQTFEVSGGTGGVMAFSKACLEVFPPLNYVNIPLGQGKTEKVPNYYPWSDYQQASGSEESEDYALARRIREVTPFRIGSDTRLKSTHFKSFGIPSWTGYAENPGQL